MHFGVISLCTISGYLTRKLALVGRIEGCLSRFFIRGKLKFAGARFRQSRASLSVCIESP